MDVPKNMGEGIQNKYSASHRSYFESQLESKMEGKINDTIIHKQLKT